MINIETITINKNNIIIEKKNWWVEVDKKIIDNYFKWDFYNYIKILSKQYNRKKKKLEDNWYYNKEIVNTFNIITINPNNNRVIMPLWLFYYNFLPLLLYIWYNNKDKLLNIKFIWFNDIKDDKISFSFNKDFNFDSYQKELIDNNINKSQAQISLNYLTNKIEEINNTDINELDTENKILHNLFLNKSKKDIINIYNFYKNNKNLSFFYHQIVKTWFNIAPARSGKTIMILWMIQRIQKKSLIIVNKDIIPTQFIDGISKFTDIKKEDIVLYKWQDSLNKIWKIWIAMIKTLQQSIERAKKWIKKDKDFIKNILNKYDVVFFDESHNVATDTYLEVLKELKANYMYWFTATKTRSDWNQFLLDYYIWQNIYQIDYKAVKDRVMKIKVIPKFIEHKQPLWYAQFIFSEKQNRIIEKQNWNNGDSTLSRIDYRNNKILELTNKAIKKNRNIIILTKRIKHWKFLAEELNKKYWYNISYFIDSKWDEKREWYKEAKQKLNKKIKEIFDNKKVKEIRVNMEIEKTKLKEEWLKGKEIRKIIAEKREKLLKQNKLEKQKYKEEKLKELEKKYVIKRQDIFNKFKEAWKERLWWKKEIKWPQVLIATYALLKEAFDWPYFDTLILSMPISASVKKINIWEVYDWTSQLIQSINRIGNMVEWKKKPLVIDIVDIENFENSKNNPKDLRIKSNYLYYMFIWRYNNVYTKQDNIDIDYINFQEINSKYKIND